MEDSVLSSQTVQVRMCCSNARAPHTRPALTPQHHKESSLKQLGKEMKLSFQLLIPHN